MAKRTGSGERLNIRRFTVAIAEKIASEKSRARLALRVLFPLTGLPWLGSTIYLYMGRINFLLENYDEAATCYQAALQNDRNCDADAYHQLGLAQRHSGNLLEAARSFRRSTSLNPNAYWSCMELGVTLVAMGQPVEAETALKEGLRINPKYKWLHYHLISSLASQGRLQEAVANLTRVLRERLSEDGLFPIPLNPEDVYRYFSYSDACSLCELVGDNDDVDGNLSFLKRILTNMGDHEKAANILRRHTLALWRKEFPGRSPAIGPDDQKPPSYIIIGLAKAGSTALYHYLGRHPQILPATEKEIEFFSTFYDAGEEWYRAHFPPIPRTMDLITGEGSIEYFFSFDAPIRIASTLPDTKFILILRDPVERAYSHYRMFERLGKENRDWEKIVDSELAISPSCPLDEFPFRDLQGPADSTGSYLLKSAALPFLKHWRSFFSVDRFLILRNEDLRNDTQAVVQRIWDFLGLPPFELGMTEPVNVGYYEPMAPDIEKRLRAWFEPHQEALDRFLSDQGLA
jgi:tetratricopeptide (TPR) repeat protein